MDFNSKYSHWHEKVLKPALERTPERKSGFSTPSGLEMPRVAIPQDFDYETDLGFPGEYPFTRGVQPTMYRAKLWTMRQYAGYASAEEF